MDQSVRRLDNPLARPRMAIRVMPRRVQIVKAKRLARRIVSKELRAIDLRATQPSF